MEQGELSAANVDEFPTRGSWKGQKGPHTPATRSPRLRMAWALEWPLREYRGRSKRYSCTSHSRFSLKTSGWCMSTAHTVPDLPVQPAALLRMDTAARRAPCSVHLHFRGPLCHSGLIVFQPAQFTFLIVFLLTCLSKLVSSFGIGEVWSLLMKK